LIADPVKLDRVPFRLSYRNKTQFGTLGANDFEVSFRHGRVVAIDAPRKDLSY
jgi:hypothetical protein